MNFQIRECRLPDDIAALTVLLHRAYAELAARGLKYVATHQTPDVTERRVKAGQCFIAEINERLVGTITVRKPTPESKVATYRETSTFIFGQFGVDPEYRQQGIGRALHEFAVRFAKGHGATAMALDTAVPASHLIEIYSRWGHREVERCHWGDTNYKSVIMKKELKKPKLASEPTTIAVTCPASARPAPAALRLITED